MKMTAEKLNQRPNKNESLDSRDMLSISCENDFTALPNHFIQIY